eukprot:TRINITY_DN13691_c0_g1_i6.p1 TRINITY_DN13691_c0_g1~~TRINITY_DN13691_c0_g1_i6.p1  ORF type:complete len:211 (-),score=36.57 TRINITY_DN13691_c0_g1_i6:50-682(-)
MIRRPPRSTLSSSSAASDVYKRQVHPHVASPLIQVYCTALSGKVGLLQFVCEGLRSGVPRLPILNTQAWVMGAAEEGRLVLFSMQRMCTVEMALANCCPRSHQRAGKHTHAVKSAVPMVVDVHHSNDRGPSGYNVVGIKLMGSVLLTLGGDDQSCGELKVWAIGGDGLELLQRVEFLDESPPLLLAITDGSVFVADYEDVYEIALPQENE